LQHCSRSHASSISTPNELKGEDTLQILTNLDTASTLDALLWIKDDGGRGCVLRPIAQTDIKGLLTNPELCSQCLQFALSITDTGKTAGRMGTQNHFQDGLTYLVQLRVMGNDAHMLGSRGSTSPKDFGITLLFYDTQTT
jgi:hypothetical protein